MIGRLRVGVACRGLQLTNWYDWTDWHPIIFLFLAIAACADFHAAPCRMGLYFCALIAIVRLTANSSRIRRKPMRFPNSCGSAMSVVATSKLLPPGAALKRSGNTTVQTLVVISAVAVTVIFGIRSLGSGVKSELASTAGGVADPAALAQGIRSGGGSTSGGSAGSSGGSSDPGSGSSSGSSGSSDGSSSDSGSGSSGGDSSGGLCP